MLDLLESLQAVLGDRYQLAGELGRGGMATVYRAMDVKHQREVAIKVMAPDLAGLLGRERFLREITIASRLNHTHIVPLYDSGGDGDVLYFVMPLITGESLRDRLEREAQLPFDEALVIARDVAEGLGYAHAQGVVHRDIKPENILLSGGRAMITDFGIARAIADVEQDRLTSKGLIPGTAPYMSPEQAAGSYQIDGRADLYALGCVLHEMLTGSPPFGGRTVQVILSQHISASPPPLRTMRSTASPQVEQLVLRLLAKVPADRFATATEMNRALAVAATSPSGAWPPPPPPRWYVKRALPLLAVALAGLAFAAWWLLASRPVPDPSTVIVFPLSAPGRSGALGVGEAVALLIGSALEHTEPLRFIDGARLMERGSGDPPSASAARRMARRAGARFYVDGAVVDAGDSVRVILRLTDVVADSLVDQRSASGPASTTAPHRLGLRVIGQILPRLVGAGGHVDLSYLEDRNPAAIADWLQGEREYASAQYGAALQHMESALSSDSAMAVAALKGTQAAYHLEDYPAAARLVAIALRHRNQLPRHHLALAQGLLHFLAAEPDSAIASFRAAAAADSSWSEPWMGLGETYYHLMSAAPHPDSLAEAAFARAVDLDPTFAPALFHLAEFAARRGEPRRARALLATFRSVNPDSAWTVQLDLIVRCAASGPDGIDWNGAVRFTSGRVVNVARVLGAGGRFPACSRRALEAVLAADTESSAEHFVYRWSALKGLNYQLAAEGRHERVMALLDSARAHGMPPAVSLCVVDAIAGERAAESCADTAMASLVKPWREMRWERLWYFAVWSDHRRDSARLDTVAATLRLLADTSGQPNDHALAEAAAARLALLRGDTTSAVRLLRTVRATSDVTFGLWGAHAAEQLLLAELLLATGDAAGALGAAEEFDTARSQIYLLYLPASLRLRAQAADRLGLAARRDGYRDRLRSLGRNDLL